jgi:glycosyltransferase involved in cell wall biosynthesis
MMPPEDSPSPIDPSYADLQRRLRHRSAELSAAHKRIEEMRDQIGSLKEARARLKVTRQERDALRNSPEYRLGRKLIQPFRRLFGKPPAEEKPVAPASPANEHRIPYHHWRLAQLPSQARLVEMAQETRHFPSSPLISIVMPVYNTPPGVLEEAVGSVRAQVYARWELIAVDDASPEPHVYPLLESLSEEDPRIIVRRLEKNAGIAMASNAALSIATGDFVAFLDHDDWIEPDALFEMARRIVEFPDTDFIYSDEDKVDETGYFQQPFFKPDWSPDAFLSINYCCHFTAIRRALAEEGGGFRAGFDGAQDYDLFLRATERARRIVHIPRVLYHWRISGQSTAHHPAQKPAAIGNGARALEDAIHRRGLDATVEPGLAEACYRVKYRIKTAEKISILLLAGDNLEPLSRCLGSLEKNTDWPFYEVILLDPGSADPEVRRFLGETRHRVVQSEGPHNPAAIRNLGVRQCDGDWLLFLENDTEFTHPDWLSAMAEHVQRHEVGAVGPLLLPPSGGGEPSGILLADSTPDGTFKIPLDLIKDGGLLQMIRNYSAVTGACMLVRRRVFEELGGFDEKEFAAGYEDIDLCLRMRERNYSIICTPYARVRRHPGVSQRRGAPALKERWKGVLAHDPFNNPNLVLRAS